MTTRTELVGPALRSLTWAGEDLIDWIGGHRIQLDGAVHRFGTGYAYTFDGATGLGEVGVMFVTLGTKARIGRYNGKLAQPQWVPLGIDELRELDRSYYHATDYAYPVCVLTLPDGRTALAHCPRRYDTLELELLDGTPLTRRELASEDIFHARLAASPDGRWLLSNGWIWQPWNTANVYDVTRALAEPAHLAGAGLPLELGAEFEGECDAAVLIEGDRVVVAGSADCPTLSVIELPSGRCLSCVKLAAPLGSQLAAWGPDHVLALDGTPRVVALDGAVVETLDATTTGWVQPSVNLEPPLAPYVAIDPARPRVAIGDAAGRIVIFTR